MKLHLLLDHLDFEKNSAIAQRLHTYVDAFVIGSLPLLKYGIDIVPKLRKDFPYTTLYVETKIVDKARDMVSLASSHGADWVSVMGGARKEVIHTVTSKAHDLGKKVILDLIDTQLSGQDVLEAATLGVDAILFTNSLTKTDDYKDLIEQWHMIIGNTTLPIFFSGIFDRSILKVIPELNPTALVLGKIITEHPEPEQEIQIFKEL